MKRIVYFGFGLYITFVFAMAGNAPSTYCELCNAVKQGDISTVNRLIADSPNLNAPYGKYGKTVLMRGARAGHVETVKVLLSAGANLEATDKDGWTALMWAAEEGHVEVVKVLLSAGANLEATDKDGWTVLMREAGAGHVEIIKVLLSAGANLKATDENRINSLMRASGQHISALQERSSSTDIREVVKWLLAHQISIMKVLLEATSPKDINVSDNTGWTALMYAAKIGSANATRLLINHGADVNLANADGWTALDIAEEVGDRGVARILRKAGAEL